MRVLIATHKWAHARPDTGESVTIPHLVDTLHYANLGHEVDVLWLDDMYFKVGPLRYREMVNRTIELLAPDVLVLDPIPCADLRFINPAGGFRTPSGCKIVMVFFDLQDDGALEWSAADAVGADVCVSLDGGGARLAAKIGRPVLNLWPCVVPNTPTKPKDLDVVFIGGIRHFPDRAAAIERLPLIGTRSVIGHFDTQIPRVEYLDLLRRAKICLNFSRNPSGFFQLKARVIEAMQSGCLVIQNECPVTSQFFDPEVQYVGWRSHEGMAALIKHYLADDKHRDALVGNASNVMECTYSPEDFWSFIFKALEETP